MFRVSDIRTGLFAFYALAGIILLVSAPAAYAVQPYFINCGSGSITYGGTVYNSNSPSTGQAGVVVYLQTQVNFQPAASGSTTTGSNGGWSITLNSPCPVNGNFYWQSTANGPLLKTVTGLGTSSSTTVTVWSQQQVIPLLFQYANNGQAQVQVAIAGTLDVSVNAHFDVGIQTGFLGVNAGAKVGVDESVSSQNSAWGTVPFEAGLSTGVTYKIQDTSGKVIIYAQKYTVNLMSTYSISEYDTISDALSRGATQVTVAPNTGVGHSDTWTGVVSVDANVGVSSFGVTLGLEAGVSNTNSQSASYQISNTSTNYECFVVFYQGPDVHIWLYKSTQC